MTRTIIKVPLCLLAVASAACGTDPTVSILTPLPLHIEHQIEPEQIEFFTDACESFELSLRQDEDLIDETRSTEKALTYTKSQRGFVTSVPIAWLRGDGTTLHSGTCLPFEPAPRLVVRCPDLTVTSAPLGLSYALADRHIDRVSGTRALLATDREGEFLAIGDGTLGLVDQEGQTGGLLELPMPAQMDPVAVLHQDRAYVWVGCPLADCGSIEMATVHSGEIEVPVSYVQTIDLSTRFPRYAAGSQALLIPGSAFDMALSGDGELVVLSTFSPFRVAQGTVLSRFLDGELLSRQVFLGTVPGSWLGRTEEGKVAFVIRDIEDNARAYRYEHDSAVGTELLLPGSCHAAMSLSPDGSRWLIVSAEGRLWLGGQELETQQLTTVQQPMTTCIFPFDHLAVAWSKDRLAISYTPVVFEGHTATASAHAILEVFDLASGASKVFGRSLKRYDTKAFGSLPSSLSYAGPTLIVSFSNGLQFLNAQGQTTGGVDPLPCFDGWTAPRPTLSGNWLAVPTEAEILLFEMPR